MKLLTSALLALFSLSATAESAAICSEYAEGLALQVLSYTYPDENRSVLRKETALVKAGTESSTWKVRYYSGRSLEEAEWGVQYDISVYIDQDAGVCAVDTLNSSGLIAE